MFSLTNYFGQTNPYAWPIDSPRVITGNYGELRPNHFHVGIDFATNGKINYPVYSIADGYVSRVKVSSVGYGKSIYITHYDGKVSVYAHLNSYIPKIAELIKKEQYEKQNFEVEFFPPLDKIKIRKSELIGLSGNSGGSTGPHLHFEIRDEKSETPLNPLEYFKIKDNINPSIDRIGFYNLSDTCSPKFMNAYKIKKSKNDTLSLEKDSIILNQGILGFAFSGFDQYLPNGNKNNIFSAKVYFDNRLLYAHTMDHLHFDDLRFVNEFSETVENFKYQKCFMPTLYPPNLYERRPTKGRILLSDTNFHKLRLSVIDENGNERVLQFTFKTRKLNFYGKPSINSDVYVNCERDFMVAKNKLQIFIPAYTLYYSTGLIFENTLETTGKIIILPREANLKSTSIIGFEIPKKLKKHKDKLVLSSGSSAFTPIVKRDSVFYSVRTLGSFILQADTIAPIVKTKITVSKLKAIKNIKTLEFVMKDEISGINKYNLFLNDKWVIGDYDAKSDLVTYYFDADTPKGILNFRLEAEDRVGNKAKTELELRR